MQHKPVHDDAQNDITLVSDKTLESTKKNPAAPPFSDPKNADTTIRTSDGVEFHVYKFILSFVSPYFKKLFDPIPSHSSGDSFEITKHDSGDGGEEAVLSGPVEVVKLEEHSSVFKQILEWIYPGEWPAFSFQSLEQIVPLFEAMIKYRMEHTSVFSEILQQLVTYGCPRSAALARPEALRVFAILYKHRESIPHQTLKEAANACLYMPMTQFPAGSCPELEQVPATVLLDLIAYHTACSNSIRMHRTPFSEWDNKNPDLKYKCGSKTGSGRTAVRMDDVMELYHGLVDKEFNACPYAVAFPLTTSQLAKVADKREVRHCKSCGNHCFSMMKAFSRIFEPEVKVAIQGIDLNL
ncbi:hypothetical protein V5O48_010061 [Marasmius crinis-equi]|uniref:BTB domain-containing protein n=1 Tax=Marasmius crinis-equi TaxID=585013 RepID=A0ABR3F9V7_9AGAR